MITANHTPHPGTEGGAHALSLAELEISTIRWQISRPRTVWVHYAYSFIILVVGAYQYHVDRLST